MQNKNEKKLTELIEKWTNFFKWRKDFNTWQKYRLWQENYQEDEIKLLEKLTPNLKNMKILDLGSGMGGFLVAMKLRGYDIQGLEPNPDYCEITMLRGKRYNLEIKLTNSYGEKMPFGENSFDFIYCNDVLEHCENPHQVLKENHRVLKPNGKMYTTVINRFGFKDPHYHLKFINWLPRALAERYLIWCKRTKEGSLCEDRQKLSEMHYFTFGQFKKMAEKIGFKVKDLKEYKILHPELISTQKSQKIIKLLKLFGIGLPVYRLARLFYMGSFELMLLK